ncbi:preprotein translocase subunit SecE [Rhodococcus sp. G-MC3]|uniref:preprotein translocase subunit SecE n=1 Tax=Rhodococcus sp. G-MC3 TaxID=3046209 RepID=UPI0024BA9344|nr:preprotein translocase subunit SecE [Rhodococcus sp. G-MC3]MDJ0392159.1 preprotein translocase subunit SecE [Rhodococcus sp. G-MC3]
MSEERGKRDETSEGVDASDSATSEDAAARTDDASSSETSARPSGKRAARRSRSATSPSTSAGTVSMTKSSGSGKSAVATREKSREPKRMNIFKRLRKFLREVIAELRKVIWPNRKQMVTYTSVVLVFVAFMVAFISGLDLAFIKGVGWLFG